MRVAVMTSLVLVGAGVLGCMPRKSQNGSGGSSSGLASVTINQPKLKEAMKASVSDADKTKLYDSLVYQISIKGVKTADNKDDCDAGVTPTAFDSEILALDKGAGDTVKVKKGCNYIVSMKYGVKSDDGKSIKTIMLQSWDDKDPAKLGKDELQKAKPTATVNLYVTKDGLAYWDISVIQTPGDSDVSVNPSLATKFTLKADKATASFAAGGKIAASASVTPVQIASKDVYCGFVMNLEYAPNTASPSENMKLYAGGNPAKSVIKFAAGAAIAPQALDFSTQMALNLAPNDQSIARSEVVYAVCADDAAAALAKANACSGPSSPALTGTTPCDTENMIVQ